MSQLHIDDKIVENIQSYCVKSDATIDVEKYYHLIKYAETINPSRLLKRLEEFKQINLLDNDQVVLNFQTFQDLETFVLQNLNTYYLVVKNLEVSRNMENFEKLARKFLQKHVPELTGSSRDKVFNWIRLYKEEKASHSPFNLGYIVGGGPKTSLYTLVKSLQEWYKNADLLSFFEINIEKIDTLKRFSQTLFLIPNYKKVHSLYTLLNDDFKKLVTNKEEFYIYAMSLKEKNSFYVSVINKAYLFDSVEKFFKAMKNFETKIEVKDVLDKLNKANVKIIDHDTTSNKLIAWVESYEQINKVGADAWCVKNSEHRWREYTRTAYFILYYDFTKDQYDKLMGVCVNKEHFSTEHAHNANDATKSNYTFSNIDKQKIVFYFKNGGKNIKALNTNELDQTKTAKALTINDISFVPPPPPPPPERQYADRLKGTYNKDAKKNIFDKLFS